MSVPGRGVLPASSMVTTSMPGVDGEESVFGDEGYLAADFGALEGGETHLECVIMLDA